MQFFQPLGYAGKVMLEPVGHQNRLAVCCFDDILQSIQLAVMDLDNLTAVIVDRTVCYLGQLAGEGCCVGGGDFAVTQGQHQFLFQFLVMLPLLIGKLNRVLAVDQLRHLQVVSRFHGNGDV